ncbi:MAG: response regulator [Planctomycetia bacterium]|nr:response regulator [Planctomycetia bacterium]
MSRHVLLCDDEIAIIRAAEIKLTRAGFRVTCCSDGQEAFETIQRDKPDLLISDCQMPRMGGLELIRRLRADEATCDLPIMMLTGKGYELPREELQTKYGVIEIIAKPFSPRDVLKIVENLFVASST